jgi:L-fuconolactonase
VSAKIIDAQLHRFRPTAAAARLPEGDRAELAVDSAITAMDAAGVDAAVVVSDLAFCELSVGRRPDRFAAVVQVSGWEEPDVDGYVAALRAKPGILGIRLKLASPFDVGNIPALEAGRFEPWFAAAERHRLPVCAYLSGQLNQAAKIAQRYPDLVLVIDHLGLVPPPAVPVSAALLEPLPEVLALSSHPNIVIKVTGAPSLSLQPYPFPDILSVVERLIDAFGADRLLWGSDYTRVRGELSAEVVTGLPHSYAELLDYVRYADRFSSTERELLLGGAALKWLGWTASVAVTA